MKIFVKVKPGSGKKTIEKIDNTHFSVDVKAKPEKGKANQAVIKILAKYLKVSRSQVKMVSGAFSRQKVFDII